MYYRYEKQLLGLRNEVSRRLLLLVALVALIWVIEVVDLLLWGVNLDSFGIRPRTLYGLRNIVLAPFLHYGFGHLIANSVPFLILGWFVILRGTQEFFRVSLIALLVSGVAIWLLGGPRTIHLGLSGVIFGYLGYLLGRGYFERSAFSLLIAALALLFYGAMLWGLLIWQPGVSWLGHTFGFLGGGLAAYQVTTQRRLPKWRVDRIGSNRLS
jgi:membrane associated rhomboid family serine protease